MEKNIGFIDKSVRLTAGVVLLLAAIAAPVGWGLRVLLGAVAGVALVTAFEDF